MKLLTALALAALSHAQTPAPKIPEAWSAWRYGFIPESRRDDKDAYMSEGYYYYDSKQKKKSHILYVVKADEQPTLFRTIELYDAKPPTMYYMNLERDGRISNCVKKDLEESWYSHDKDPAAKDDGEIRIGGAGYPLLQYFTKTKKNWEGKTGSRYQTFSKKSFIPVRDDFWIKEKSASTGNIVYQLNYEQFENVTLAEKTYYPYDWSDAFEIPPECKKSTPIEQLKASTSAKKFRQIAHVMRPDAQRYKTKAGAPPQVPTQWYGHRVVFDPDYDQKDAFNAEGSYYYDGEGKRKASVFRFNDDEIEDRRFREIELYDKVEQSSTCYRLDYDAKAKKWVNCTSNNLRCKWYDHNPDYGNPSVRFDGTVTIGTGYPLAQFTAFERSRDPGQRYQTFSEDAFVPVRDDFFGDDYFRYEQFENVTLASKDAATKKRFEEAFALPSECKKLQQ